MIYDRPRFLPGGDSAVFIEFGDGVDPVLNRRVRRLLLAIQGAGLPGVVEIVPAYRSLLVHYRPRDTSPPELRARLEVLVNRTEVGEFPEPGVTEVPTVYGGEYGPDLEFVARHSGLSREEVVRLHAGKAYLIYMLGFMPGFPYLGSLSPRIVTPRLETPRTDIPAGSVGIGGSQTGIYPAQSPGGWRLIGRTPLELFCPRKEPPALLQMGDYVRFVPITEQEFKSIRKEVEQGTFRARRTAYAGEAEGGDI